MESGTLETYRQRLLKMQQQLTQRIVQVEDTMYAMDVDRDIERTDRVQEEAAEVRIAQGTYGVCASCGKEMSLARLTAMPMARRCVPCQERLEHGRRI